MSYPNTYSLQIIIDWVHTKDLTYKHSNAGVGLGFVNHGIRLALGNDFELSIQTHPDIAVSEFAETALIHKNKLVRIMSYGEDIQRWSNPEELFAHIEVMMHQVKHYKPQVQV